MTAAVATVPSVTTDRALTQLEAWSLITTCRWYELALRRHGFTIERLQKLAHRIARDELQRRGATLKADRYDDLHQRLVIAGMQAAVGYDPAVRHSRYGANGGDPIGSYLADVMANRITDYFRSKAEGFGDRRYGNDDRIELSDDPDPADHDVDFHTRVDDRRRAKWQQAAKTVDWELDEWIMITLDHAADSLLARAAA